MAAYSDNFPWPNSYGHFNFFEERMHAHGRVRALNSLGDGLYQITRLDGTILKVFVCECYAYGVAEYAETVQNLGHLDAIIISSVWCGYTYELKLDRRDQGVGVFKIAEFMGALNHRDFWRYLTTEQEEYFREKGLT